MVNADAKGQKTSEGRLSRLFIESVLTDELRSAKAVLPFTSNVVAVTWPKELLDNGARSAFPLHVRGLQDDVWSAWLPLEELEYIPAAGLPNPDPGYSVPVFFDGATQ